MRRFTLLLLVACLAGPANAAKLRCAPIGDLAEPTATFLRRIDHLTFDRNELSTEALREIAASERPVNPADFMESDREAERHGWRAAFERDIASRELAWPAIRAALKARLGEKAAHDERRDVARNETAPLPAPIVRHSFDVSTSTDWRVAMFERHGTHFAAISDAKGSWLLDLDTGKKDRLGDSVGWDGMEYFEQGGRGYLLAAHEGKALFFDVDKKAPTPPLFGGDKWEGWWRVATVHGEPVAIFDVSGPHDQTKKTKIYLQKMDSSKPTLIEWDKAVSDVGLSIIRGKPYLHGVNERGKLHLTSLEDGNRTETMELDPPEESYPGNAGQAFYETPQGPRLIAPHQNGAIVVDPLARAVIERLTFDNSTPDPVHVLQLNGAVYGVVSSYVHKHVEVFDLVRNESVVKIPASSHDRTGRIFAHQGVPYVTFGDRQGNIHLVEATTGFELAKVKVASDGIDGIRVYPTANGVSALVLTGEKSYAVQLIGPKPK